MFGRSRSGPDPPRRAGGFHLSAALLMAAVLAACAVPYGFASHAVSAGEEDAMSSMDGMAPPRFDTDDIDSRTTAAVVEALLLYRSEGADAFEMISPEENIRTAKPYPFVLNATTLETVANGAYAEFSGVVEDTLTSADRPVDSILADLARGGGAWVEYMASNPDTGTVQPKRSWLYLNDGYIFGSGHYLPESRVKHVVEDAVQLHESRGMEAFEIITFGDIRYSGELYPIVFDADSLETVAHGAIPDRLGHVPYAILNTGDRSIESIREDLARDGGTWVEYVFTNPDTNTKQLKRTWLYQYGDYIYGSGYYIQDQRAQSQVDTALLLYASQGEDAFGMITPGAALELAAMHPFVLDSATFEMVAHGSQPGRVGQVFDDLMAADKSPERIVAELREEGGIWVAYMSESVDTNTRQLTRAYLSMQDGYIFGSGYSFPDSRIQSMVDEAIYTYRSDPSAGFEVISSGALNRVDIYPAVRNATHILAHGTLPHIVGPLPPVQLARSYDDLQAAANSGDGTAWSQFSFVSPYTKTDQIKRGLLSLYDGHFFASTYSVQDGDTRSTVDYAMFIYESNKEDDAWKDIITPAEPVITDEIYPFVMNATTWETEAHGVFPDRVGLTPTSIQTTSLRPFEAVQADLDDNGRTWVTYIFLNPDTGTHQYKRTYLEVRDGLIFAAGYYILDSQAQTIAFNQILEYKKDRDAAFARINVIPEDPISTYFFAVDPETGTVQAQNVDPSLIGMSDWDAITSALPVSDVLEELEAEPGAWVSYQLNNPATGELEGKRTWLIMHDGLVFGSGYYSSDSFN